MEAALVGVIGRIAPLLFGFLHKKYELLKELEGDIQSIQDEFLLICSFIEGAGDHPLRSGDGVSMTWIEMVRNLARDIEDCVDHFTHLVSRKTITTTTRLKFAEEIKKLKKRSVEAGEQKKRYITENGTGGSTLEPGAAEAETLAYTAEPVGMDAARRELMELIRETPQDQPKKLRVISIVGFGGIGKSQLARYAYDTIDESEYTERAWVPAAGRGAGDILQEIHRRLLMNCATSISSEGDSYNLRKLRARLHSYLDKKRFFIVIDGLRTSYWGDIKGAFPVASGVSSRVIVTTARHSIATKCSVRGGHVYVMRTLGDKDSRELFFKTASLYWAPRPGDTELGSQVIEKCDGLPLALLTTAELLPDNPSEKDWADLGKNLGEYLEREELGSMKHVLDRSYTSLGSQEIKTCLLYLGIYPSGHPIKTGSLIRKWLAEGFIKESRNPKVSSLMVAVRNFNELVDQSIIQPIINVSSSNSSVVKACQTHGMMLEYILHKSMGQNFVTLLYGEDSQSRSKIRWLSLQHNASCKIDPQDLCLVRSLTIFGKPHDSMLDFSKYKLMKVLDLEECRVEMGDSHLKNICSNLVLLRYLSLGAAVKATSLPEEIRMLMLLETLDVRRTKIEILPTQVMKLPCLVHLFGKLKLQDNGIVDRTVGKIQTWLSENNKLETDNGIGDQKLKELQAWLSENSKLETLAGFVVDKSHDMPQLIEHMNYLTKVNIWCDSTADKDKIIHLRKAIEGFIQRGTKLDNAPSLSLNFNTEWHQDLLYLKLKNDRRYYLRSLKLQGNEICSILPLFLAKLGGLTKLCLSFPNHKLSTAFLDALRHVKCLEYLKLVADELGKLVLREELRRLCVVAKVMTGLEMVKEAQPRLESLGLLCKDLNGFSGTTIQSLPLLKEVTLHYGLGNNAIEEWKQEVKNHPRRPKLLIKLKGSETATDMMDQESEPSNAISTEESDVTVEEVATIEVQEDLVDEENGIPTPSPFLKTRPKSPTSIIPCSPSKTNKNNVPQDLNFVDQDMSGVSNAPEGNDIAAIMEEVEKCGASEMSDEYYMATKLFDKSSNRKFFYSMKTSEGRLNWLKRQFEDDRKRN